MPDLGNDDEIKDLIKRKTKLIKDPSRLGELGDIVFQLGHIYYDKGYYNEALNEFEYALEVRRKIPNNSVDVAVTHRLLGETCCKIGVDFERAKMELDRYHSITLRLNDLVEIQRSHTTLGNYFMALCDNSALKSKRMENLNEAYSHYLKSYDVLNEIWDKRLVDAKEFGLMKARTCLNCAFVLDEKRDLIICNEYLKTAIEICEANNFYEDLIRCYYIKVDQAKRKNRIEESLKMANKIIEITAKSKDYVQQSSDYLFVAEVYIGVQNFEKAKYLLRKAYKLRKKCLIQPEIRFKLKHVMQIIRAQRELTSLTNKSLVDEGMEKLNEFILEDDKQGKTSSEKPSDDLKAKLAKLHEKLADSLCSLGLFELGLENYLRQLDISRKLNTPKKELSVIYASIAQTYQDLHKYADALAYYNRELDCLYAVDDNESACKSLLNVAIIQEKLNTEYEELKETYWKAYEKAKQCGNTSLQFKCINLLKQTQEAFKVSCEATLKLFSSLSGNVKTSDDEEESEENEEESVEDDDDRSLSFSSESEEDDRPAINDDNEERAGQLRSSRLRPGSKKYVVKRNLRGETQLHVACIKGNFKMAKKLVEEGHPINERDNLNWLPIHEACNYGHLELVDLLVKNGAKINDLLGPITPLHDAAQNGHLEVVKLLLKAGALSFVFSQDGYTPLDFLVKYKEDNENSLSSAEIQLYKEIYDMMLTCIRTKDKNYKVKKVVLNEDNDYVSDGKSIAKFDDEGEDDDFAEISKRRRNQKEVLNCRDKLTDDSDSDNGGSKLSKNKKAVKEYREAMGVIGSKAVSGKSGVLNAPASSKNKGHAFVSEEDYNMNENWLIDDMNRKANASGASSSLITTTTTKKATSSATKRKHKSTRDVDSDSEAEDEEDDFLLSRSKKPSLTLPESEDSNESEVVLKPKKKNADSGQSIADRDGYSLSSNLLSKDSSAGDKSKGNKRTEFFLEDVCVEEDKNSNDLFQDSDFILSPFKSNKANTEKRVEFSRQNSNNFSKQKASVHQQKLTKMKNYKLTSKENSDADILIDEESSQFSRPAPIASEPVVHMKPSEPTKPVAVSSGPPGASWKIKAVIDGRNYLIPVSNINATIDELTLQIVTRYKVINSNEPSFREPDKVTLKSSDDLILFGKDLISDVLNDQCQVQLVIETWKDAPSIADLYDQACSAKGLNAYQNIKLLLNESESSNELLLKSILNEQSLANIHGQQLEIIFESIKLNAKQSMGSAASTSVSAPLSSSPYIRALVKIDLSANMLADKELIHFIDTLGCDCINLKQLDLSFNLLTSNGLKTWLDLANSRLNSSKSGFYSYQLESLNLSGNPLGPSVNSSTSLSLFVSQLISLLQLYPSLKQLSLTNCKINLEKLKRLNNDDNSMKKLFSSIKNSKLAEFDVSFNKIGFECLTELVENLPGHQVEHLAVSNCNLGSNGSSSKTGVRSSTYDTNPNQQADSLNDLKYEFSKSINKFIWHNLRALSLRNLALTIEQTSEIVNGLCCSSKNLRMIDLSYNFFESFSIKSLLADCKKLEEVYLVNLAKGMESSIINDDYSYGLDTEMSELGWFEMIKFKFNESGCMPLKRLELKLVNPDEVNEIKSLFRRKWSKNAFKIYYYSKNVLEFRVE